MSNRWKELERTAARKLRGERVPRWLDFGQSAPDVLMRDIEAKYCVPDDVPVLIAPRPSPSPYGSPG